MSDAPAREWKFYLDDMIGFTEKVITYTDGSDQEGFVASGLNYDATLRNLELRLTGSASQLFLQCSNVRYKQEWQQK